MSKHLSLYLDLLRFFLAFAVFISHARSGVYTGGIFWWTAEFAQPAVMAFFVLSGFVIAFVVEKHKGTASDYFISRLSRLYSVLIPCLVLTFFLDNIGFNYLSEHYENAPLEIGQDNLFWRYLAGTFMLTGMGVLGYFGDFGPNWHVFYPPGTNGPLWSLSNEIVYYALFGFYVFLNGWKRWVSIVLVLVVAGPEVVILFPVWLAGLLAFAVVNKYRCREAVALVVFTVTSLFILYICMQYGTNMWTNRIILSRALHTDYLIAVLVAINIFAASSLNVSLNWLQRFEGTIRVLGALTFPLYLCHRPLLQFLSGFQLSEPGTLAQNSYIIITILAVSWVITKFSDIFRMRMKQFISKFTTTERKTCRFASPN